MKRAENKGQGVRDLVQNGAKRALSRVALALALLVQTAFSPFAVAEENPYSPALMVNGRVISNYELKQRNIFFSLLQPDLDATSEARKSLIDDRLRQYAAEKLGVTVSPDEIAAAAGLVMGQGAEGQPAVLLRGLSWSGAVNPAAELLRPAQEDLFQ